MRKTNNANRKTYRTLTQKNNNIIDLLDLVMEDVGWRYWLGWGSDIGISSSSSSYQLIVALSIVAFVPADQSSSDDDEEMIITTHRNEDFFSF
jgi:hypothetical protein